MISDMKIQTLIVDTLLFLNKTVVPLLFALAFLFFVVNVVRYFIIGGDQEDARGKAKMLALWGIVAFVVMVSIWGIVNLLTSGFGIGRSEPVCPDFLPGSVCFPNDLLPPT